MIPYSTRRNNELEISYQTCAGKGRRLALCIWNEVFTGLPAGNDMQRQNDLRVGVSSIHGWWPPSVFVAARRVTAAAENASIEEESQKKSWRRRALSIINLSLAIIPGLSRVNVKRL